MSGAAWTSGQPRERQARKRISPESPPSSSPAAARAQPISPAEEGETRTSTLSAKVRLDHPLVRLDDSGRPLGDLLPVVQDEDGLAELHDDLHVVLDDQDGLALVPEARDGRQELVQERAVHPGRRLVQQDQLRGRHQHADELQELLLAGEEGAGGLVGGRSWGSPPAAGSSSRISSGSAISTRMNSRSFCWP